MKKYLLCLLFTAIIILILMLNQYDLPIPLSELPQPAEERMLEIQSVWDRSAASRGFPEGITFCDVSSNVDGIRYYGSYQYSNWNDKWITCDLLYIPCSTLGVSSRYITFDGMDFISHNAFALVVYHSGYFYPLRHMPSLAEEERIALMNQALQIHQTYEKWFYGSVLTQTSYISPDKEYARVQAAWLAQSSIVCDFEGTYAKDYWGSFDGWDIFLDWGVALAETTHVIAGHAFTFGSACTIYAHKDGSFYRLQEAYAQGLISAETIGHIADPNNHWKPSSCDDSNGKIPNHEYRSYISENATCETDGTMQYLCNKCNSQYSEVIPALGHNYVDHVCQNCGKIDPPSQHGLTLGIWYNLTEDRSLLVLTFFEDGTFSADFYNKTLGYDEYRKNSRNLTLVEMDTLKVAYRNNADRYSEKGTYTIDGDILTLTCPYFNYLYECWMDATFQLTMTDRDHMTIQSCSTSMINPVYEFETGNTFIWAYLFIVHK